MPGADYVLSSYEADVVKPLIYFFYSGCHGELAGPVGASLKRKIPRGSSKEFANLVSQENEQ